VSGRLVPVLLLVLLFLLMIGAMVWGWRRRGSRQQDLPELLRPIAGGKALETTADPAHARGVYVSTTLAEQPLERVVARGLGARSRASLTEAADAGRPVLLVDREGAPSFLIPLEDVVSVHTAPGMAGKWVGGDGLLVVRWQLGETVLDTGFRLDRAEDQARFLDLAPSAAPGTATTTTPPDSTAPEARKEHP
jgi:hypothetical protein